MPASAKSHAAAQQEAIQAVSIAMGVARAVQRRRRASDALTKSDASPVTVADFAVQAIVAVGLERALGPDDLRLVGEESAAALRDPSMQALRDAVIEAVRSAEADIDGDEILRAIDLGSHAEGGAEGVFWTIDPIDGTKGFLRNEQYCIALARIENGEVTFAVLGCPNLPPVPGAPLQPHPESGTLLVAERGAGAWQQEEAGANRKRVHRAPINPRGPLTVCDSVEASSAGARRAAIFAELGVPYQAVQLDSQCKYALVARGEADAYLRVPRRTLPVESIWDHAAGTLIASEAGAAVCDLDGRPLDFGRGRGLSANRGVLACAAELRDGLVHAAAAERRVSGAV